AIAYWLLVGTIRRLPTSGHFDEVFGADWKGRLSIVFYAVGIGLCFIKPWLGVLPYVAVALMWLIPDRRVERWLQQRDEMPVV
ncbi:MAG: TMEM175 family protein, partial [Nocardioides sp.]